MSHVITYLLGLLAAYVAVHATIQERKRRRISPSPTRRERLLRAQLSLGSLLLALSLVVGGVPLIFAIGFLNASGRGKSHRESVIVITVIISLFVVGLLLSLSAERKLRQLRSLPWPRH